MEKTGPKRAETRTSQDVADTAANAAEKSALELEQKATIARSAAIQARIFAHLTQTSSGNGRHDDARDYAKRAIQEARTAADAASLIL